MNRSLAVLTVLVALALAVACAPAPQPPTATPDATPADGTVGALAELGRSVYGRSCAGCHGAKGGGVPAPALIGPNNKLTKYGSAKDLLDYIIVEMPVNRPGELASQEYEQVLALLLLENGILAEDADLNAATLDFVGLE